METISEIKGKFQRAGYEEIESLINAYIDDDRKGVRNIINSAKKKLEADCKERQRIKTMRIYEEKYDNLEYICGIDEVGRGPFAGPVVACALVLPKECEILYVNDSKKLSEKMREKLCAQIKEKAIAIGIGSASNEVIDDINILNATYEAMRCAINNLKIKPDILLNDAVTIPDVDIRQEAIIKGDQKSISIASASIVAKVTRDHLMEEYDKEFPQYGFAKNKGYGTREHIEAILKYGPCSIHRRSFIHSYI